MLNNTVLVLKDSLFLVKCKNIKFNLKFLTENVKYFNILFGTVVNTSNQALKKR